MKIAIVVPAHIPPTKDWIYALEREAKLGKADVIIVDDSGSNLLIETFPDSFRVFNYEKQKEFLGDLYEDFAKLFHRCAACRVFGHLVAYKEGYDVVIGLDSDCIVPFRFVESHMISLSRQTYGMTNPFGNTQLYSRGYPYHMRNWQVAANMGMWDNVLDLNGKDRKPMEPNRVNAPGTMAAVSPLPFSGMNFAIKGGAIPGFLFIPNFTYTDIQGLPENPTYNFRRVDDVWGGYIFQLLAHKMRHGVVYGQPIVFHDTVVNAAEDAAEEEAMYKYEEAFIKRVDFVVNNIRDATPKDNYASIFEGFVSHFKTGNVDDPFKNMLPAMEWWVKACKAYEPIAGK